MSTRHDLPFAARSFPSAFEGAAAEPRPTPLSHLVKEDEVEQHRCLSCTEYDQCLEVVLVKRWRSWSCASCGLFLLARAFDALQTDHEAAARPFA